MEITSLTIVETHAGLLKKEFSCHDLVLAYLKRIEALNPRLHAYLSIFSDSALKRAEETDAELRAGDEPMPLEGIPLAMKDNMLVAGTVCTAGSKILEKYVSAYDATVVEKLRDAGAIILGKTNMDEFAHGASTEFSAFGPTHNPWNTDCVPGGSSGGSAAAVSADCAAGGFGSDTGGSIRQPASLCSVVGMKPTYGRVSRYGLMAMGSSLDQIGPFGKTVEDARILYNATKGKDPRDSTTIDGQLSPVNSLPSDLKGVRVGIVKEFMDLQGMDPGVETCVKEAIHHLESLGATLVDVSIPRGPLALAVYYIITPSEISANLARFDGIRYGLSCVNDPAVKTLLEVYEKSRAKGFGPEVRRRIMVGTYALSSGYYDAYYRQAQKVRTLICQDYKTAFEEVDCLAFPTSPTPAFRFGEKMNDPVQMYLADVFTVSANVAGVPAISIPCGFTNDLPVGLQLTGAWMDEDRLFDVAHLYEQTTDWHKRKPPIGN